MQFQEEQEYTKRFDAGLWKRLLYYSRPFYKYLAGVALCMMFSALMDTLFPLMNRYAIDTFVQQGSLDGIGGFATAYVLFVLFQVGCIFSFIHFANKTEIGLCHRIRRMAFARLQEQPFSYYDHTPVGYLIARMTNDTQRLGDTVGWTLVDLLWGSCYIIFTAITMFSLDWRLTLAVLAVVPPIAVISLYFQKKILASYRMVRKTNSKITGAFNEGIMGAKTTKTLVREDANYGEFQQLTGTMKQSSIRAAVLSALFMPIVVTLGSFATAYVLWKGGYDVFSGTMTVGTLGVFISYSMSIFEPIRDIARIFADLQSSQAAAERVITMMETEPDIQDRPEVVEKYGTAFDPKRENWEPIVGDIEFKNVSFQYKKGEKVLKNFSLKVRHGQTIALVGETGSGKSTIVNLICRFYEPTEGSILIDGRDYRERSQLWLHSNLGYVLQTPHLFTGTIADNIRYGNLDATDEQVRQAARMVGAEEFIMNLEKGYDTDVGEGGNRLSTGQKQLLSFARALVGSPRIFVLDEATSSVDTETEQAIQRAISSALEGRTSFIIAHRLSTIRTADRILVIQNGEVIEEGTHRELIAQRGHYYDLYTNQFRSEKEADILGVRASEE
ncbi:MAG: ABC transporter ATP-binding protein [Candidatus Fimadaptatus sp.]